MCFLLFLNVSDLYLIHCPATSSVKIGKSKDVYRRLRTLQTGSAHMLVLLAVLPGESNRERSIHNQLASFRRQGEWFSDDCLASLPDDIYARLDLSKLP